MTTSTFIGYFCLTLWCVISAISRVYASGLIQVIDPFVLCFYIFLITCLFFWIINIHQFKGLYKKVIYYKKQVIFFNITTFGNWFFIIYPLKYIEPALIGSINLCLASFFTFVILPFTYHNEPRNKSYLLLASGFLTLSIYMFFIIFFNKSSLNVVSYLHTTISVIFIAIGAFSLALTNIYAKRLSDIGFEPIENLAIRFFVLVIVSAILAKLYHDNFLLSLHQIKDIFLLSFLYAIVPLYFIQISTRELKPFVLMSITPLMPLMTFLFQGFSSRFGYSYWTVMSLILAFLLALTSLIINYKKYTN